MLWTVKGSNSTHGNTPIETGIRINSKNKRSASKTVGRRAHKVNTSRITITPEEVGACNGKKLSGRKVVWLKKLKHYLNIAACNFRLKLHLHLDQEGRKSLKDSREESKEALNILKNKETRRSQFSKAKEDLEDSQYIEAARRLGKSGFAGLSEGKSRFLVWLRA